MNPVLRRLLLSIVATILAGGIVLPRLVPVALARTWGFFLILGVFLAWVTSFPLMRTPALAGKLLRGHLAAVLLAAGLTVGMVFVCPPEFRILSDETNLLGISYSMVREGSIENPLQAIFPPHAPPEILLSAWDTRPTGFPFAVSLLHFLTGYRPENSFILNGLCGFFTLLVFYLILNRLTRRLWAIAGMVLLAGVPLFVLIVTGGSMEPLNICLFLVSLLFFLRFLETPSARNAEYTGFTLAFFAYTRYEAALMGIPFFGAMVWLLPPVEYAQLRARIHLLPLLYLPLIWHRLGITSPDRYHATAGEPLFGLGHLGNNLLLATDFFRNLKPGFGSSPLLVAGFLASLGVILTGRPAGIRKVLGDAFGLVWTLSVLAYALVIFSYHTSDLTIFWAHRLGCLFFPFFIFVGIRTLSLVFSGSRAPIPVICLAAGLLLSGWPVAASREACRSSVAFQKLHLTLAWMEKQGLSPSDLLVTDMSNLFVPFRRSAVHFQFFRENPGLFQKALAEKRIDRMFGMQHVLRATGTVVPQTDLPAETFTLREVETLPWHRDMDLRMVEIRFREGHQ